MTTRAAAVWIVGLSFIAFAALLAERGPRSPHVEGRARAAAGASHPNAQPPAILTAGIVDIRAASQREKLPPFPTGPDTQKRDGIADNGGRRPGRLTAPGNAAPLESRKTNLATLRAAIRQELPHAPPAEIEFWVRELKGMKLHSALDLLRMRRLVPLRNGTGGPIIIEPTPLRARRTPHSEPSLLPPHPDSPVFSRPVETSHFRTSVAALQQGLDVILNNLANANTPGFKRSRAVFGELPPVAVPNSDSHTAGIGAGVCVAAVHRDWSQGELRQTGRPLDVAIVGEGFFVVRSGAKTLYTRYGSFHRTAARRLELRLGGVGYRLASGGVPNSPAGVDGIRIASIPNPDGLKPLGNGLFATTTASGPARLAVAGAAGNLKTGCLEASNVDLEKEMLQFRRIARQIETLKAALSVLSDANGRANSPGPVVNRRNPARSANRKSPAEPGGWWSWR
ncbi:MAG: flagellar hook-basal body protein [Planctomycetaceae bacterium]